MRRDICINNIRHSLCMRLLDLRRQGCCVGDMCIRHVFSQQGRRFPARCAASQNEARRRAASWDLPQSFGLIGLLDFVPATQQGPRCSSLCWVCGMSIVFFSVWTSGIRLRHQRHLEELDDVLHIWFSTVI